mmetsp:Transcript_7069/g.20080  ORF Transcript_7069/g.20080 Transcript_7069/m.20080 type:complete len:223 (-) Transcript_7069:556-1224(-)
MSSRSSTLRIMKPESRVPFRACHVSAMRTNPSKWLPPSWSKARSYSWRYSLRVHLAISRSASPGSPQSSKKMQSKTPRSCNVACHVPSTTRTLGLSAAQACKRLNTGSEHSMIVCVRGRSCWIRSALKPQPKPTSRTSQVLSMAKSRTHSSIYGFSHFIMTCDPSTSNNCSLPSRSLVKVKPSAHWRNSEPSALSTRPSPRRCNADAAALKAAKTPSRSPSK